MCIANACFSYQSWPVMSDSRDPHDDTRIFSHTLQPCRRGSVLRTRPSACAAAAASTAAAAAAAGSTSTAADSANVNMLYTKMYLAQAFRT